MEPEADLQNLVASSNQFEREIRFAVVIYGGVSLAVYINGIVQELLHMVRSTAVDVTELSPVEKIYRRLASKVGAPNHEQSLNTHSQRRDKPLGTRPGKAGLRPDARATARKPRCDEAQGQTHVPEAKRWEPDECASPIYSRFIVDILSGTSAGGINAIYLAKALVNNQSIDSLARMWVTDADLSQLLNDNKVQPSYLRQSTPRSLLNSSWMYYRLLTAFNAMNAPDPKRVPSKEPPDLVDDLDLYCTTTDLRGLPVEIALTDENVQEQRYRNFYRFKRRKTIQAPGADATSDKENNLTPEMDPFLAFAARCTSSFPFAFEPMELGDISVVVRNEAVFHRYLATAKPAENGRALALFGPEVAALQGAEKFAQICRVYQSEAAEPIRFDQRPFGDGGYLDNKPFTYAIETMRKRHATLPVDRKLIYVEPDPETFQSPLASEKSTSGAENRPNAVENSLDALVELPRYETIRQDIESVIQWNADIARLHRVLEDINQDIENAAVDRSESELSPFDELSANRTYWRLRLSGAADQLSTRMAETIDVDPSSAQGQALRSIAAAWRLNFFPTLPAQQRFLDLFDFDYCERAIRFLRARLQQRPDISAYGQLSRADSLTQLAQITSKFTNLANEPLPLDLTSWKANPQALACWKQYLTFIVDPKAAAQTMGVHSPLDVLRSEVPPPTIPGDLSEFLSASDRGRDSRVQWLFDDPESTRIISLKPSPGEPLPEAVPFRAIVDVVAQLLVNHYSGGELAFNGVVKPPLQPEDGKTCLQGYFDEMKPLFTLIGKPRCTGLNLFRLQDIQIYPIVFGTTLGEFETVDIFRISPRDTRPVANTTPPGAGTGSPPLRGASLGAFGAFFDQRWRLSDMLRGRLDGAERLITAVLPDSDQETINVREELIQQAQEAIATEWQAFQASLNLDLPSPSAVSTTHLGRGGR